MSDTKTNLKRIAARLHERGDVEAAWDHAAAVVVNDALDRIEELERADVIYGATLIRESNAENAALRAEIASLREHAADHETHEYVHVTKADLAGLQNSKEAGQDCG